jgi:hypothetical protein
VKGTHSTDKKGKSCEGFGATGSAWQNVHVIPLYKYQKETQVAQRQTIQANLDESRYSSHLADRFRHRLWFLWAKKHKYTNIYVYVDT